MVGRGTRAASLLAGVWLATLTVNRSLRRVQGTSMVPTLEPGDIVVTLPIRVPRRGEVVVVRDPRDPTHEQVKRVVALPGETIELRGGTLLLDGRRHREPYRTGRGADGSLRVPADHVAVLGDARAASTDSRTYGAVPLELVTHRVALALRPGPRRTSARPVPLTAVAEAPRPT